MCYSEFDSGIKLMRQVAENIIAVSIALAAVFSLTNWEYASDNPYFSQETYIIGMVCFCIIISLYHPSQRTY